MQLKILAILLLGPICSLAQVGIGTSTPDPSSALDLTSTTKGILIPRLTTSERDLIANPATGLLIFNSTSNRFEFFTGAIWSGISSNSITNSDVAIGASIEYNKLDLNDAITNSDISTTAGIDYSKLALTNSIKAVDIENLAGIPYDKLNLSGSILSSDIHPTTTIGYSNLDLSNSVTGFDIAHNAGITYSQLDLTAAIRDIDVDPSAGIDYSKLYLTQKIQDSDINPNNRITYGNLDLTNSIQDSDIGFGAISYSKLNLFESITNDDIEQNANIPYSKLNLYQSITGDDIGYMEIEYSNINFNGSITASDIDPFAQISYNQLYLYDALTDWDISSSAGIAFSKLNIQASDILGLEPYSAGTGVNINSGLIEVNSDVVTNIYSVSDVQIDNALSAGGIGDPSAILSATSSTRGFLPPRMTALERSSIISPTEGLMVYQSNGKQGLYVFNGSIWLHQSQWYENNASPTSSFFSSIPNNLDPTDAEGNLGIGSGSLSAISNGDNNIGIGVNSLNDVTTAGNNTALGYGTLSQSTGIGNTAVGYVAGAANMTGIKNTYLGYQANASGPGYSNSTALGNGAEVTSSNMIRLGNTDVTAVTTDGAIGIGTNSPNNAAALEVVSTTKGVLMPRMSETQRDAISSPVAGLVIFNLTTSKLQVYTGGAWENLH